MKFLVTEAEGNRQYAISHNGYINIIDGIKVSFKGFIQLYKGGYLFENKNTLNVQIIQEELEKNIMKKGIVYSILMDKKNKITQKLKNNGYYIEVIKFDIICI